MEVLLDETALPAFIRVSYVFDVVVSVEANDVEIRVAAVTVLFSKPLVQLAVAILGDVPPQN